MLFLTGDLELSVEASEATPKTATSETALMVLWGNSTNSSLALRYGVSLGPCQLCHCATCAQVR